MAQYGIMRVEKRKLSACGGLQAEHQRTVDGRARNFDRSNIDWSKTALNEFLVHCDNWGRAIQERSQKDGFKIRGGKPQINSKGRATDNSSVAILDALYTASPEWFEEHSREEIDAYFRECLQYHIDTYCQGDASRVLSAVVHWDETTPHLHVASIPIVDDGIKIRLSAKDLMGNKAAYRQRQQTFWEQVSREHGLERGDIAKRPEERRKHIATNEYTLQQQDAEIEQNQHQIEALKQAEKGIKERRDAMKEQINDMARERDILLDGSLENKLKEHDVLKAENDKLRQKVHEQSTLIDGLKRQLQDLSVFRWLQATFPGRVEQYKKVQFLENWWADLSKWVCDFTGAREYTKLPNDSLYTFVPEYADIYMVACEEAGLEADPTLSSYATHVHDDERENDHDERQ